MLASPSPQIHIMKFIFGGGVFRRWLGHKGRALMNRISSFIREIPEHLSPLWPCDRKWLIMSFFWGWLRCSKVDCDVMAVQLCDYTKNHWIVHLKWMDGMECGLYLNKLFFEKVQVERWVLKQGAGLLGVMENFCNLIMVVVTRVYNFLNLIELYVNSSSIKLTFKSVQNPDKARLGLRISSWASRGLFPSP